MNDPRQPGPGREREPDASWYLRRPASDDETGVARRRPTHLRGHIVSLPPTTVPRPLRTFPGIYSVQTARRHRHPGLPTKSQRLQRIADVFSRGCSLGAGGLALLIGTAVLLGGVTKLGITGGKFLDVAKVQAGVLQTLSDPASGYGANTVTDVSCNNGHNPSADKGTTFTCDATVNGAQRHVAVVVSDDHGTYEIDGPR